MVAFRSSLCDPKFVLATQDSYSLNIQNMNSCFLLSNNISTQQTVYHTQAHSTGLSTLGEFHCIKNVPTMDLLRKGSPHWYLLHTNIYHTCTLVYLHTHTYTYIQNNIPLFSSSTKSQVGSRQDFLHLPQVPEILPKDSKAQQFRHR